MAATTIKVHQSTKDTLDELRSSGESYDDVIVRIAHAELKKELVEGYKNLGNESRRLVVEWDRASPDVP